MGNPACPLCGNKHSELWDVSYFPKEIRVSLRLMDVDGICFACWGKHVESLSKEVLAEVASCLMDDLFCLKSSLKELEEESAEKEKRMGEEIEELEGALEDVKSRINEIMR